MKSSNSNDNELMRMCEISSTTATCPPEPIVTENVEVMDTFELVQNFEDVPAQSESNILNQVS